MFSIELISFAELKTSIKEVMRRFFFLLLTLSFIIFLILFININSNPNPPSGDINPIESKCNINSTGKNYHSGTGWSNHFQKDSAVINAIKASECGSLLNPEVTFLMYPNNFNTDSVLNVLQKHFKKRKIFAWGVSHGYDLFAFPDGSSKYSSNTVTAFSINYPYLKTGIASGTYLDSISKPNQVTNSLKEAYENAGVKYMEKTPNKIIIIAESESKAIFSEISKHFNNKVPTIGGWIDGSKIANFKKLSQGNNYIIALLFSDKEIGWDFRGGFSLTKSYGQVTKCKDGVIYEINNKSSNEVYSNWTGDSIAKVDVGEWGFICYSTLHPLYLKKYVNDIEHLQFMHPTLDKDKNIKVQKHFNIKNGDTIYYTKGNYNMLINHLSHQPGYALNNIPESEPSSALVFCCASYPGSIPKKQHALISQSLKLSMKNKPWLLTFTLGEHGYISGVGNMYGNLMTGILIFPKP